MPAAERLQTYWLDQLRQSCRNSAVYRADDLPEYAWSTPCKDAATLLVCPLTRPICVRPHEHSFRISLRHSTDSMRTNLQSLLSIMYAHNYRSIVVDFTAYTNVPDSYLELFAQLLSLRGFILVQQESTGLM